MNRFHAYALFSAALAIGIAPGVFLAHADGVQETGIPACPMGMDGIRFFIGNRHLATVCMAKAELERAQYISGPDKGMVACQTIVVKGR